VSIRNPSKSKHHRSLSPTIYSHSHPQDDPKKHGYKDDAGAGPSNPSSNHRRALSAEDPSSSNPRYSRLHANQEYHQPTPLPENRHDRASTALLGAGHRREDASALSPTYEKDGGMAAEGDGKNGYGYTIGDNEPDRSDDGLLGQGSRIMCDNGLLLCAGAAASAPSSSSSVDEGEYGGRGGASSQECAIL
jgi:hypothetical protein